MMIDFNKIVYNNIIFIIQLTGIYFVWIFLHFISAHLYVRLCNQPSFVGFILSPFLVTSLHCQALRWTIYNGANHITSMWLTLGTWIIAKLMIK
jgi:hypothetical protein